MRISAALYQIRTRVINCTAFSVSTQIRGIKVNYQIVYTCKGNLSLIESLGVIMSLMQLLFHLFTHLGQRVTQFAVVLGMQATIHLLHDDP